MGKAMYDAFPIAKEAFDEAGEALGLDIAKLCFDGPAEELDRTENTQPALLAASIAALRVLEKEHKALTPVLVAGHSLGEYTALVAAGALSYADALRIVRLRGRFMQEAVPTGTGRMAAVLGLTLGQVEQACAAASTESEKVVPANINSPTQIVISGHAGAVDRAAEEAKKAGAGRVVTLPVSVPSHSPLMQGAADRLEAELARIEFGKFKCPLVSNVLAEPVADPEKVRELLKRQLTSPVRWADIVLRMKNHGGIAITIEIGPGSVLTGLVRRIDGQIFPLGFSGPEDNETLKRHFGKGMGSPFRSFID